MGAVTETVVVVVTGLGVTVAQLADDVTVEVTVLGVMVRRTVVVCGWT